MEPNDKFSKFMSPDLYWFDAPGGNVKAAPARTLGAGLNVIVSGWFSTKQHDELNDQDDDDGQLQDERPGLMESLHHEFIKLTGCAKLLFYQVSVIRYAHLRGGQAVKASTKHVAQELDAVIAALRQLDHLQTDGIQALRLPRQFPARKEAPSPFERRVDALQHSGQQIIVIAKLE